MRRFRAADERPAPRQLLGKGPRLSSLCGHLFRLIAGIALLGLMAAAERPANAASVLQIDPRESHTVLQPFIEGWSTEAAVSTLDEARQAEREGKFAAIHRPAMNLGFVHHTQWLHFSVERPDRIDREWLLVLEYPLLDHVDVFRIDPDGQTHHWMGGDRLPFKERSYSDRYINFAQLLEAPGRYEFYVRARSESSMQIPLVWTQADAYLEQRQLTSLGIGLYFGVLAALMAYNLILFISVRDRNFLHYVLYVASIGWMLLNLTGLGFQLFWPELPDWNNLAVLLSMAAAICSMTHFTRRFLNLQALQPRSDTLLRWLIYLALALGVSAFFLPYHLVVQVLTLLVFPTAILIYVIAIVSVKHFAPAKYFIWAWTALLLGIMIYAAVALGWLPKNPLTEYSIQFGSAAEMVLLSFALAYRINMLTEANRRRLIVAQEELEDRVQERTQELDEALHRLETANRQLREFSRQDGLTGLLNRRSFDHSLNRAEEGRVREDRPFALLMIDIDRFKEVNDQYGHLVGDDALVHVARLLQTAVAAAGGQLARYGGEEFAVILPSADFATAQDLAEALRQLVEQSSLQSGGRMIPLSVSVGAAFRDLEASEPLSHLVRRADEAMYRAKQAGRNRTASDIQG